VRHDLHTDYGFIPGTTAPQARQGTINSLSKTLVDWARNGIPS
jgi:hypothetical protein